MTLSRDHGCGGVNAACIAAAAAAGMTVYTVHMWRQLPVTSHHQKVSNRQFSTCLLVVSSVVLNPKYSTTKPFAITTTSTLFPLSLPLSPPLTFFLLSDKHYDYFNRCFIFNSHWLTLHLHSSSRPRNAAQPSSNELCWRAARLVVSTTLRVDVL